MIFLFSYFTLANLYKNFVRTSPNFLILDPNFLINLFHQTSQAPCSSLNFLSSLVGPKKLIIKPEADDNQVNFLGFQDPTSTTELNVERRDRHHQSSNKRTLKQ